MNRKGELLKDNSIRSNFNAGFKAVGLDWSGTHIARHTFATLALMSEGKIASVQAALGHQSSAARGSESGSYYFVSVFVSGRGVNTGIDEDILVKFENESNLYSYGKSQCLLADSSI